MQLRLQPRPLLAELGRHLRALRACRVARLLKRACDSGSLAAGMKAVVKGVAGARLPGQPAKTAPAAAAKPAAAAAAQPAATGAVVASVSLEVAPPGQGLRKVTFELRESERANVGGAVKRWLTGHGVSGDDNVNALVGAVRQQLAAADQAAADKADSEPPKPKRARRSGRGRSGASRAKAKARRAQKAEDPTATGTGSDGGHASD